MSENIQVPQGWEVIEFCNIVNLRNKKYIPNQNENIKCIELECIEKENGNLLYCINSNTQKSTKNYFYKNDVLYGKLRPYLKKYFYATFDGVCSTEIWVFNATNKIDSYYLFLIIQSNKFNQYTNISTGTRMPRADWNIVSNLPVLLPPLEEQKKIADILSLWDKAIEQTKDLIAYKEKQKKGLMQALLTGKKRLQGFTDEWKTVKLGECFKNFGGAPLEKYMNIASKYKFISIGNYSTQGKYIDNGNRIILNDITQTKLLNKNDLVMVLNDKTADGKIIGATILIDEDNTYIYNQRSERLVCNKNVFPLFFWFLLNSELIRKEIFAMAQGGTQIYINFSSIKSIKIFLPPLDEQKAIADILSSADEEIQLLNKQLELYTEQKKGLMQNLLTGKVRV